MPSTQGTSPSRNSPVFSSAETLQATQTPIVYILRCIPARTAVLVSAVFLLVCSSLFCSASWTIADQLDKYLTDMQKVAIYFHLINCVFIWGASLVGIYAAGMNKKPSHSQLFAALPLGQIIFGIASGAWCLQIIFATTNSGDRATKCATMHWAGICRNLGLVKVLSVVAFEVMWILEIVAIYVANRFAKQLREEDLIKCISSPTNSEYA